MNSLPTATTPQPADDTEVLSLRLPERGEVTLEMPQSGIPEAGHAGFKIPADRADGSRSKPDSHPDTMPEPSMAPDAGRRPLAREGELMTHKYRGSIIVLSISKSVEPNEEQKEMISGFQQGILCKY